MASRFGVILHPDYKIISSCFTLVLYMVLFLYLNLYFIQNILRYVFFFLEFSSSIEFFSHIILITSIYLAFVIHQVLF